MRFSMGAALLALFASLPLSEGGALAQSASNFNALRLLVPVSTLEDSEAGRAALARNQTVTLLIRRGIAHQPRLQSFVLERGQALRDAFITAANADQLADGLGSRLGNIYQAATCSKSTNDGEQSTFTNIAPSLATLFGYADATEYSDSRFAKYFFANGTADGKTAVLPKAIQVLTDARGTLDVFGRAYGLPARSKGAGRYGNSRPFQTETARITFKGDNFFAVPSSNYAYLTGPSQDLTDSPSYPSGHTASGYTDALLLALLVPDRYPQMITRAAEYGNSRIILGAHYPMDVIGGRTLALFDVAQLLANNSDYTGKARGGTKIDNFMVALEAARTDLDRFFEQNCKASVATCATEDQSRFASLRRDRSFYEATQTYNLPAVHGATAKKTEDVGKLAHQAGYLLTAAFPNLSLDQADAILTATEGPGGGFLDDGSAFGIYSRLDLFRASETALDLNRCDRSCGSAE